MAQWCWEKNHTHIRTGVRIGPRDSAISSPGTYPKELKTGTETNTCTRTCIAESFTTASAWKKPKCPMADEWINPQG